VRPEVVEELERLLPQLSEISFGGGEPLIVAKAMLDEVIRRYPHLKIGIVTNGTLFAPYVEHLDRFKEINISLNASNAKLHERICGSRGFEAILKNVAAIRDGGFKGRLSLLFVICRENLHDVKDFVRLCAALGVKDYSLTVDVTDPFLRIPAALEAELRQLNKELGLRADLPRLKLRLNPLKKVKQVLCHALFYVRRRRKWLAKRSGGGATDDGVAVTCTVHGRAISS
jgi:MoaA/NifB/PqqE/SkfB family radical SAM enzyme